MKNKIGVEIVLIIFLISLVPASPPVSFAEEKKETVSAEKAPEVAQPPAESTENPAEEVAAEPTEKPTEEVAAEPAENPAGKPVKKAAKRPAQKPAVKAEEPEEKLPPMEPGNVTVNFKGADIRIVLAYIAEVSGVDIVPAPDVKGVIDLKLTNKPWKVALDIITRNYGFAYERDGDIIRVITIDKLKQEELTSQVFTLNYSKGKEVVNSLKDIVSSRGKVIHDERTNTVLVTDIPTNLYKIAQIIERLDRKTEQVLIEARVIETVLDDSEKLGIDWNVKFSVSGASRPTTLPFDQFKTPFESKQGELTNYFPQVYTGASSVVNSSTTSGITSTTTATDFPVASGAFPEAFPFAVKDNFTFGTLDFTQFTAVLEMIKSRANTDIVSNPTIATLNNSEALISIGTTLNLPRYERSSGTGKMEITGYIAKDLGVILKVTPHVNENGEIVVDLEPQISDLLRYDTLDRASGVVAPVFSLRQAKTKIMIKDGDTIFIGGLIKENDIDIKKKLPFFGDLLGDVPYLGLLFTKKEKTKQKTELIFFITVNLMATGKEIRNMPQADKAYIPMYTITQAEDVIAKKRLKARF